MRKGGDKLQTSFEFPVNQGRAGNIIIMTEA